MAADQGVLQILALPILTPSQVITIFAITHTLKEQQ